MKLLFYFLLPMIIIEQYWYYIAAALAAVFLIPGDWWKRSPASQPNTLVGKPFPNTEISLRNFALRVFAVIAFFLLLPLALILPLLMVFVLPVIFVTNILSRKKDQEDPGLLGLFLLSCLLFFILTGMLAPINVIPIALYFLMGKPAGNAIETLAIGQDAVRDDIWMGVLGIVVVTALLLFDAFWRLKQARQVENLPRSKVGSLAIGLVEVRGTARKIGHANKRDPILRLKMDMFSYFGPVQQMEPFEVEDETGRVLVDPKNSHIRAGWITDLASVFTGFHEVVLDRRIHRDDRSDAVTRTLMDGDPVYVIGNAEINRGKRDGVGSENLVIRPSEKSNWNPSFWRFLFGSTKLRTSKDFSNVFFISDSHEEAARQQILKGFRTVWAISFFWLLVSSFLLWSATWPERQQLNPEGWRNAYWRGPEPNPNVSVLDYSRNHRVFRFEDYMKTVTPQSYEAIPALIEAIGYKDSRFARPATIALLPLIPALKNQPAEAIDVLRRNLRIEDAHLRQYTILALASFGYSAVPAIPDLIEQLRCSRTNTYEVSPDIIRFQAARALGEIGPYAAGAIPHLQKALNDPSPSVRDAADRALARIQLAQ